MANATSTIRVNIIGDAAKLGAAVKEADSRLGGLGKAGAAVAGAFAALTAGNAVVDFAQDALGEWDRLGDAVSRLDKTIGTTLSQTLRDTAGDFARLGLSTQDMLELEANFADIAKASGVASPNIADMADDAAAIAAAMSLVRDEDPATLLDQIAKAGTGSARALRDLGVAIDETEVTRQALLDTGKATASALTDSELAAARFKLVLEKLRPYLDDATTGTADLEQRQRELQARIETLQAKVGGALEGPLNDLLGWVLQGIDGWEMLADKVGENEDAVAALSQTIPALTQAWQIMLGPLGLVAGKLSEVTAAAQEAITWVQRLTGINTTAGAIRTNAVSSAIRRASSTTSTSSSRERSIIIQTGSDPEQVTNAIKRWNGV